MRIIHLLSTLSFGDAVGNDTIALWRLTTKMGFPSRIYTERADSRYIDAGMVLPVSAISRLSIEDIIIYHLSISTPLHKELMYYSQRKILIYHNITPSVFFNHYNSSSVSLTLRGRNETVRLRSAFDYGFADSEYNRQDLLQMGYTCPIDVLPILIPFEDYNIPPSTHILQKYSDGRTNLLFVGRIAPNKKQEDILSAFAAYRKLYNPSARLFLVGSWSGQEKYFESLRAYQAALGLSDDDVVFSGHIPFPDILAFYSISNIFLCMSEHEGFCVPLLEAMHFKLPIIAFNSSAIP
jgi:glycosyltransferase involved in cell wall biosynthesis